MLTTIKFFLSLVQKYDVMIPTLRQLVRQYLFLLKCRKSVRDVRYLPRKSHVSLTSVVLVLEEAVLKFKRSSESLANEWHNIELARQIIKNSAWHLPEAQLNVHSGGLHIKMPIYQPARISDNLTEVLQLLMSRQETFHRLDCRPVEESWEYFMSRKFLESKVIQGAPILAVRLSTILSEVSRCTELTVGVRHGDFRVSNIREFNGRPILIDFEDFSTRGIMEFDLIDFWIDRYQCKQLSFWGDRLIEVLESQYRAEGLVGHFILQPETAVFYALSRVASDSYLHSISYSETTLLRLLSGLLRD